VNVRAAEALQPADWLARLHMGTDRRVVEAATDVVETLHSRPTGVPAALRRFGFELGSDGWPISEVTGAVERLGPLTPRRHRKMLRRWQAVAALAEGWASGYVRGAHTGMCLDPITGLGTQLVLRLRLAEMEAACAANGTTVADAYCAVLIDLRADGLEVLSADLLYTCAAAATTAVFDSGETVARVGDRLVVLASRDDDTARRAEVLYDRLSLDAATAAAAPSVVVDELPSDAVALRAYVGDLTA